MFEKPYTSSASARVLLDNLRLCATSDLLENVMATKEINILKALRSSPHHVSSVQDVSVIINQLEYRIQSPPTASLAKPQAVSSPCAPKTWSMSKPTRVMQNVHSKTYKTVVDKRDHLPTKFISSSSLFDGMTIVTSTLLYHMRTTDQNFLLVDISKN